MSVPFVRQFIASQAAGAHLAVCQSGLGVQVTYTHRGTAIPNLWCMPKSTGYETMRVTIGTRTAEAQRTFEIPTQTNFPPLVNGDVDLPIDDTITDEHGDVYGITANRNPDDIGAVYEFQGVHSLTKQVGAVGQ